MEGIIQEATKIKYAKKYKCPYCDKKMGRDKLIYHIDRTHEELIPQEYSATQVVFNLINKKEKGTCTICGKETKWNEDKARYERFCSDKCKDTYIKTARDRNIKTYGVPNLLQSKDHAIDQQLKMLNNRHISGTYKFSDGTPISYTGNNEKHTLEFLDQVLKCESVDIQVPGPIVYYQYGGKKHFYIPDLYYIPYNLLIEVKDGGDNPNNRPMKEYREKQVAKEKAIIDQGQYNYLRLTNNNFEQLLLIFAELKMQLVENHSNEKKIVRINESGMAGTIASALPNQSGNDVYMTQTLQNNVFSYGVTKDPTLSEVITIKDKKLKKSKEKMTSENTTVYRINTDRSDELYNTIIEWYQLGKEMEVETIYELCTDRKLLVPDQIACDEWFELVPNFYQSMEEISSTIKESLIGTKGYCCDITESSIKTYIDQNGKYLYNESSGMRTRSISEQDSFTKLQKLLIGGTIHG